MFHLGQCTSLRGQGGVEICGPQCLEYYDNNTVPSWSDEVLCILIARNGDIIHEGTTNHSVGAHVR